MPTSSPASTTCFATCPKGLEGLLMAELASLGAGDCRETVGGVRFHADLALAYRCCLWSRLANRVLWVLADEACRTVDDLYRIARALDWDAHLDPDRTFAVDFSGTLAGVQHSHFGALRVKDAIADYFTQRRGRRPDVQPRQPHVLVNARARKGRLVLSIDLSGDSLHRRGYRLQGGSAPLKENLAAALLLRADWPAVAARGGALLDPMCGSGTLLIEGALMAAGIAPGILRGYWGFSGWKGHRPAVWKELLAEAEATRSLALKRAWPEIRGYDTHPRAIEYAQQNIDRAGLNGRVRVLRKELAQFRKPTHTQVDTGLVITNPPYGERLGDREALVHLYRCLGDVLKREFTGWRAAVFTGNPDLGKTMGLRSDKQYALFNGTLASKLLLFAVDAASFVNDAPQRPQPEPAVEAGGELTPGAQMLANRLRKNLRGLEKWARREQISCYRIYDADIPEYAVAVDRYDGWIHIAEYAAPASVDANLAQQRLGEVLSAVAAVTAVAPERIVLKQRSRQRGNRQYQRLEQAGELLEVSEGRARLLVNLRDYLDTGLFLDHRPVRLKIAELARGTRFLNLFCYTATATVHAALGGAKLTDSVDLSATYLDWARKNLALNGFDETRHRLLRADVRQWLEDCDNSYDLVLLDPPSFSNSKKMQSVLDIQRDHCELIHQVMRRLAPDGLLIFSNNLKKFRLHESLAETYAVDNKTAWSLDKDFQRSKTIHQCWFLRHRAS